MDIGSLWNVGIVGSLEAGLIWLYSLLGSWGLAIIVFTLAVRFVLIPLTMKQLQSSKAMQEIQPLLSELQKKYKNDREKLMQEQMKLYKERGVNPMAGCLPMLVQMPIWFGLYQALIALSGSQPAFQQPFLWLPNLALPDPFHLLAVLTGATQWIVQRMMTPRTVNPDQQQQTMNMAMQFMPLMFAFFAMSVPSGLALYWVATNVFSMVQQYFITGWGSLLPLRIGKVVIGSEAAMTRPSAVPSSNGMGSQNQNTLDATESESQVVEAATRARRRRSRRR